MTISAAFRVTAVVLVATLAAPYGESHEQTSEGPEFEVASIKRAKPDAQGFFIRMQPGGRFSATGVTIKFLLEQAYDLKDSQVSGAPSWLDAERYDIDAKPDEATSTKFDKLAPDDRRALLNQMMQALLVDRFKLTFTHETKDLPTYALVVGKNGPKFHESSYKPPERAADAPPPPPGQGPPRQGVMLNGRGELTVTYADLAMFCNVLSHLTSHIVVDKTGLTGKYDFTLKWTPEEGQGPMMPPGLKPGGDGSQAPPAESGPSLFTAVQEQLGLKLESQKTATDVLVIQHVEKPTEN